LQSEQKNRPDKEATDLERQSEPLDDDKRLGRLYAVDVKPGIHAKGHRNRCKDEQKNTEYSFHRNLQNRMFAVIDFSSPAQCKETNRTTAARERLSSIRESDWGSHGRILKKRSTFRTAALEQM
jgi:hypothetical protein